MLLSISFFIIHQAINFPTHRFFTLYITACTLGLLLTMAAAMYVGRLVGGYVGIRIGFWVGLLARFLGGFAAAWSVRSVWGRLVPLT